MIVQIVNPDISENEITYLSADAAAGASSLTVQNTEGFTAGDYIVVGKYGVDQSELCKISTVSGNSTITLTAVLKFSHSIDTPITFVKYNQYVVYSASSKTGSYSQVGSATDIEVDSDFSEFEDTSGSSSTWYKFRFYNSTSAQFSDYSDPVQGSGYTDDSVKAIMDRIYVIGGDKERRVISEVEMMTILNDGYRIAVSKVMKSNPLFYLKHGYVDIANSYNTGTVSVSDGGTAVTGSGTSWSTGWTGRRILFQNEGFPYQVSSVGSTTALTLTTAYQGSGSNLSGATYKLFKVEYDVKLEDDATTVTSIRRIHRVVDEDGTEVFPHGPKDRDHGFYLKRVGDSIKFCLNYIPDTNNAAGRWSVDFIYQPSRFDSMGDVPELPVGFDGALQSYGLWKLKTRMGENDEATSHRNDFQTEINSMTRRGTNRAGEGRSLRLPTRTDTRLQHDSDWADQVWGQ